MSESRQSYCHKHRVPFFGPPCNCLSALLLLYVGKMMMMMMMMMMMTKGG